MSSSVDRFSPPTQAWFAGAFAAPTAAQSGAWEAISRGQDTLVVAPTGSGKTLAAFLWSLDRLITAPAPDTRRRCRVLYVSPLKALAVDVERNLRAPLAGIRQASVRLGLAEPDVRVGTRSGDTPADERRRFASKPPDILITTPESLFLILTSQAREALRGVETVIVDEVHAVAATKRGAHLALSLERLDALLESPAQRIGLSATVRPVEEVARFLSGTRPVTVVAPPAEKSVELTVVVPVDDMAELGETTGEVSGSAAGEERRASIWPHVEEGIVDLVERHRSTIVFANSRRLAERLTARLNEIATERAYGDILAADAVPAQLMAQAGATRGSAPASSDEGARWVEIARAHHGSVSREQRSIIEEALKAGRLPAVVATSSLELGIDMGAVDLVVQVESPPSVASGLQRVGRAGHQVGAVSRGVIFPKYRGDLVQTAVVAERMRDGAIEALRYPRNPLDVLAQQIVAMVSMDEWSVDDLGGLVRRAANFAGLPQSGLEAVLDMLAGRYPSDAFAELRPRLVWDRLSSTLTGRPGAQRLAVTSGGTIPDRGLFGVFLVGEKASRVGELDEEMVYESRAGDVFTLGSTSWRIEDITHDRVLVSPAPGQPGKLPFWHGDTLGRPLELGRALGRFVREVSRLEPEQAHGRVRDAGLDELAATNLLAYLDEQRQATGHLPDDRTIVVERFRDELGDWRVAIHSPFGAQVHAPWALAVSARLRERHGLDVQVMHSDDGIVLRLPDTEDEPPSGIALVPADDVEAQVTDEVGGSALFAARFRECAARALLLPRRDPARRTPLWQQRQRSAQLLSVASEYGSFPIVLEAMRECLQDVFDVPGLVELMREVEARRLRVVEVETPTPSPFARSLLFGYVAAFMYEGDSPLAERRAQALTLDATLLSELLGQAELRELLDPAVVVQVEAELQRRPADRRARGPEGVADLVRTVGPISEPEVAERVVEPGLAAKWLEELESARRILRVRIAGEERYAAVEDAGRLRDALGAPLPVGVPEAFLEPVRDPLGDLVARYARTHGPFLVTEVANRLGLGVAVVADSLRRLAATRRVVEGEFRPSALGLAAGSEWCDAEVLRIIRRRSLAALRKEVEPVPPSALARFLPAWQQVGARLRGSEGVLRVVEQLQGAPVPLSALESLVLPARVGDYAPPMLDELTATGEVVWAGHGSLPGHDGWVALYLADAAPLLLPPPDGEMSATPTHDAVLDLLARGGGYFFRQIADSCAVALGAGSGQADDSTVASALWDLLWSGHITNDTFTPARALLGGSRRTPASRPFAGARISGARRPTHARYSGLGRPAMPIRSGPPNVSGRWSLLPARDPSPTRRAHAVAELLLERHGVLTRGAVTGEEVPGGFAAAYRLLSAFEETGRVRRGYFVEGLGAAQFAVPGAVDRMRAMATTAQRREEEGAERRDQESDDGRHAVTSPLPVAAWAGGPIPGGLRARAAEPRIDAVVLAATDPASPFGHALPWPERVDGGHKPGRKAGALVVLVDGELVLYVERGGRSLLTWSENADALRPAVAALASSVRSGALGRLTVERVDGSAALTTPLAAALEDAGFSATPRGLRLRA